MQQQDASRFGRVGHKAVVDTQWSTISTVHYTQMEDELSNVVLIGPDIAIALGGSVNRDFLEALEFFGARIV